MEYANVIYYNDFDLKLIEDALFEISVSKLEYGDRKFVLRTGERGATQFSKAVKDMVSGWYAVGFYGSAANNPAVYGIDAPPVKTAAPPLMMA